MAYVETALYCDSVAYNAIPMWTASTVYTVGQIVRQRAAPAVGNERCFVCVTAGTSAATEPTWQLNHGQFTSETGGLKWQECTAMPAMNGDNVNTNNWNAVNGLATQVGTIIKNVANTLYLIGNGGGTSTITAEPAWSTTPGGSTLDRGMVWITLGPVSAFTARWAAPAARLAHLLNSNTTWLNNAGMTIYVGDDHAESSASSINLTNGFACSILCVDHTAAFPLGSSHLRNTASVTAAPGSTLFIVSGSTVAALPTFWYGFQFIFNGSSGGMSIANGAGNRSRFEQCTFYQQAATSGAKIILGATTSSQVEAKNCTFRLSDPSQYIQPYAGLAKLENCSFVIPTMTSANALFGGSGAQSNLIVEGSDLSVIGAGALMGAGATPHTGYYLFKDCLLPSGFVAYLTGAASMVHAALVDLVRCDAGGNYRNERYDMNAAETTSTSVVRSDGANDNGTPISHRVVTTANASDTSHVFNAIPLAIKNATIGSRTVTLYGIVDDSRLPKNNEVWPSVEFLGSSSSPQGSFVSARALPLAVAASLAADTSAWDSKVPARNNNAIACWSLVDIQNIVLSNNNLTAVTTTNSPGVRYVGGFSSGKWYFEATMNVWTGGGCEIGWATAGATLTGGGLAKQAVVTKGTTAAGGIMIDATYSGSNLGTRANGDVIGIAIDIGAGLIWFRVAASGNWNGSGTANPATGAGGLSLGALAGTVLYPIFAAAAVNESCTANFGGSAFVGSIPSGFSPVGSAAVGQAYVVGSIIKVASNPGRVFFCTGAGTSEASEPGSVASATWNLSDATAALSGGNLVATVSANGQGARSNAGQATGKFYFEVSVQASSTTNTCIGVGSRNATFSAFGSGPCTGGIGITRGLGTPIYRNGGLIAGGSLGDTTGVGKYSFAIDLTNKMFWVRWNGGLWNGTAGADPAFNVGGVDMSQWWTSSFPAYAIFGSNSLISFTANFGATAFAYAVPAGFSAGPVQIGYTSAVDGDTVSDGGATFRAGCRFKTPVTITPQQAGYVYAYPKFGRASANYYLDPVVYLS
jgi:SPRY domain